MYVYLADEVYLQQKRQCLWLQTAPNTCVALIDYKRLK